MNSEEIAKTERPHYLDRPENSDAAQEARRRYINANENVHRAANRGASKTVIAGLERIRDRHGEEWRQACNPPTGTLERVTPEDAPAGLEHLAKDGLWLRAKKGESDV